VRYRRQTDCHPGYEWLLIVTGSHRLPQTNICKCAKSLSLSLSQHQRIEKKKNKKKHC
jgi:hypothetical protein